MSFHGKEPLDAVICQASPLTDHLSIHGIPPITSSPYIALAGVHHSHTNAWPLVLLAGSSESFQSNVGMGAFQEMDQISVVKGVGGIKWVFRLRSLLIRELDVVAVHLEKIALMWYLTFLRVII